MSSPKSGRPKILVLNGPNLNLLGSREPEIYGSSTLADIEATLRARGAAMEDAGLAVPELEFMQTNREHEMIERVHAARDDGTRWILINPGAWTHTSIALRDAFLAVGLAFVEIHLSNVHAREEFRRVSYLSDVARGVIAGLGPYGYVAAYDFAVADMRSRGELPGAGVSGEGA